jgi:drug/metabolite transporter (DMT)-like permease
VASYFVYLQPIIVTIIALWLGQQDFSLSKILAALLIFAGVYLVSRKQGK